LKEFEGFDNITLLLEPVRRYKMNQIN